MPRDSIDLRVILGSTTPPGRLHRAVEGAIERADFEADLFAATTETAAALAGTAAGHEPSPLAAKAIKPRTAAATS